nr:MAG TPA: hypothetical protein [Crassvirales sp.]
MYNYITTTISYKLKHFKARILLSEHPSLH